MKLAGVVSVGLVLLSFGGCLIDQNLAERHIIATPGPGWFHSVCEVGGDESHFSCQAVLQSKWAYIRIGRIDPETGERGRVSVALLGWFYFAALFVWFVFIGRPNHGGRFWYRCLLILVGTGCLVSAFYTYIMFTRLEARCLWCLVSHAINFLILIGIIVQWPRRVVRDDDEVELSSPPAHPTGRLAMCAVFAALLVVTTINERVERYGLMKLAAGLNATLQGIHNDADSLVAGLLDQPRLDVPVRSDDPVRFADEGMMPLVLFSDFQCPACRQFARHVDTVIHAGYPQLFRVIWKHYPSSTACNPAARRDLHPAACEAAQVAEAARSIGGNDGFWRAHDWLFEHQEALAQLDYGALAAELGTTEAALRTAAASDVVRDRVAADIEQAIALKVAGTPGMFIDGRLVRRHTLHNQTFLARLLARAERAKAAIAAKRAASSTDEKPVIPGSPDQPGAR